MAKISAIFAWLVVLAISDVSYAADASTAASLTMGQFIIRGAESRVLVYADVCVSHYPSMKSQYEQAMVEFKSKYMEVVAPLVKKYGTIPQFNLPAPQSWFTQLEQENSSLRTRIASADLETCKKFLSNLGQMDFGGLQNQVESDLLDLEQLPLK